MPIEYMSGNNPIPPYKDVLRASRELSAPEVNPDFPEEWSVYDSSLHHYEAVTFELLLQGRRIEDFVAHKERPAVLDLMASSEAIADIFKLLDHPGKGIALTLADNRNVHQRQRDASLGIKQLTGDITAPATWRQLEAELGDSKADLILERAYSGLENLPVHPKFFGYAMQNLWDMLNPEGGVLLIQIPSEDELLRVNISPRLWLDALHEAHIYAEMNLEAPTLLMIRQPDSPSQLP